MVEVIIYNLGACCPVLGELPGGIMDNLQTLPFNMGDDDFSMALKGYQCHGQSIVIDEENGQPCVTPRRQ